MRDSFQFIRTTRSVKNPVLEVKKRAVVERPRARRNSVMRHWKSAGSPILLDGINHSDHLLDEGRTTAAGVSEKELLHLVNYIDEEGLLAFPGIGKVMAEQIKNHIRQVDYCLELEELLDVPRFGKKRFEKLVGRSPRRLKGNLRQLMRIGHHDSSPICLRHFQPWSRPASGIAEIWLIPSREFFDKEAYFESFRFLVVERVGSYRLVLACEEDELQGRASYLLKILPRIIRSINYERSFTTAA